jgi:signal transduction histidine kinase
MEAKRAETDNSLRTEREDTDKALRARQAAERAADKVVDLARRKADALLVTARSKADQGSQQSAAIERAVGNDRARADEVLHAERKAADDRLRCDREDGGQALAELLWLERARTDRDLLTERARSDEAIANRDDFLGIVSHDLRNLLGGIVLSSASLSKNTSETDEGRRTMVAGKRIQLYAARMNRLIGDLVDVVSIDAGRLASTIVPSDPLALIAETLATFRRAAAEKGIALGSEVAGDLPLAAFDHERMLQVFANLIANAIKFTETGGKIRIRGERAADEVHFSVSDTGVGIPESLFDAVFLRFWQVATNDPRGLGLGLYISKSLVEAHRGRIWIESRIGRGSTFHFTAPIVASA